MDLLTPLLTPAPSLQTCLAVFTLVLGFELLPFLWLVWPAYRLFWIRGVPWADRVQPGELPDGQLRHEIVYSLSSAFVFSVLMLLVLFARRAGAFPMLYLDPAQRGWPYFAFSVAATLLVQDLVFYLSHRLLHTKALISFHAVHHRSKMPTPFAFYSFHPIEAVFQFVHIPIAMLIFPVSVLAVLVSSNVVSNALAVYGHLNYEIRPPGWLSKMLPRLAIADAYHNAHHVKWRGNYGLYLPYWDRLFSTSLQQAPAARAPTGHNDKIEAKGSSQRARRALVTGASEGIGNALAKRLASEGYAITAVARNQQRLDALLSELPPGSHRQLVADLLKDDDLSILGDHLRHEPYDLLVNCAGAAITGLFHQTPLETILQIGQLNNVALTVLSHHYLSSARPGDALINVSSGFAFMGITHQAIYCATKSYANTLTTTLWAEQRERGVYVMSLCPGYVITQIQQRSQGDPERFPPALRVPMDQIVDITIRELKARKKPVVITGLKNRILIRAMRALPFRVAALVQAKFGDDICG